MDGSYGEVFQAVQTLITYLRRAFLWEAHYMRTTSFDSKRRFLETLLCNVKIARASVMYVTTY